jgi:hypothetical protein
MEFRDPGKFYPANLFKHPPFPLEYAYNCVLGIALYVDWDTYRPAFSIRKFYPEDATLTTIKILFIQDWDFSVRSECRDSGRYIFWAERLERVWWHCVARIEREWREGRSRWFSTTYAPGDVRKSLYNHVDTKNSSSFVDVTSRFHIIGLVWGIHPAVYETGLALIISGISLCVSQGCSVSLRQPISAFAILTNWWIFGSMGRHQIRKPKLLNLAKNFHAFDIHHAIICFEHELYFKCRNLTVRT